MNKQIYNGIQSMTYLCNSIKLSKLEGSYLESYISRTPWIFTMLILIILSEIFLFMGLFWGYYNMILTGVNYEGIIYASNSDLVIYITLSLALLSILGIYNNDKLIYVKNLKLVSILFCNIQVVEYNNNSLFINDEELGNYFYIITGLHYSHILVGILLVTYLNMRYSGIYSYTNNMMTYLKYNVIELNNYNDFSIVYLHFVELLWLLIYLSFY